MQAVCVCGYACVRARVCAVESLISFRAGARRVDEGRSRDGGEAADRPARHVPPAAAARERRRLRGRTAQRAVSVPVPAGVGGAPGLLAPRRRGPDSGAGRRERLRKEHGAAAAPPVLRRGGRGGAARRHRRAGAGGVVAPSADRPRVAGARPFRRIDCGQYRQRRRRRSREVRRPLLRMARALLGRGGASL